MTEHCCGYCGKSWADGKVRSTCPYCEERDLVEDNWTKYNWETHK